jgi:hypothetical protein
MGEIRSALEISTERSEGNGPFRTHRYRLDEYNIIIEI